MNEEIVFVDGIEFKKINDDFYAMSFNVERFTDFMNAYKTQKGYVNINLCKSKKYDKFYGKLNVWEPKKQDEDDKIPF